MSSSLTVLAAVAPDTLPVASPTAFGVWAAPLSVSPAPPQPTVERLLLHISFEPEPIAAVVLAAGLYLLGVRVLADRGDSWNRWRTVSFLTGLGVVAYALVGGVAAYDTSLFSAHAVQHMLLGTLAPVPLALGAPVTLVLRALPPRPRRLLVAVLHSRVARVITFPLVGFALFIVSLYGLYFTSLYPATLEHYWLHLFVHVHFLVVGCIFYWPIIGVDPVPGRIPYWGRLILLFVTFPVHALWSVALFTTDEVFAQEWYTAVGRTWGASLLNDQHTGAGLMWASGELVGAIVFVALFVQWSRADEREAAREDRRLDRLERLAASASASEGAAARLVGGGTLGGGTDGGSDGSAPTLAEPTVPDAPAGETELDEDADLDEDAELLAREAAYNAWLAKLAATTPPPQPTGGPPRTRRGRPR